MEQKRFAYLFQRYVHKSCSAEEYEELMIILRSANHQLDMEAVLDDFWDQNDEIELPQERAAEILQQVVASAPAAPARKNTVLSWLGWAAIILIAGLAVIFKPAKLSQQQQTVKTKSNTPAIAPREDVVVRVQTTDEHQKVTLPDGSTVILNSNSSLTYHKLPNGRTREVGLTGEGYFDIKHDDQKPFIVYTGAIKTTVLGTAFNIKAYKKQREITVTVTRGKVSVVHNNEVLSMLTPGQQIVFNKERRKYNFAEVVAKNSIQWQESDLFFDDVSMEEAAQILSKRFNVPISFEHSQAAKCRFTATFLKGESLQEILKLICSFNHSTYQSTAGGITIKGQGCE